MIITRNENVSFVGDAYLRHPIFRIDERKILSSSYLYRHKKTEV